MGPMENPDVASPGMVGGGPSSGCLSRGCPMLGGVRSENPTSAGIAVVLSWLVNGTAGSGKPAARVADVLNTARAKYKAACIGAYLPQGEQREMLMFVATAV